MAIGLVQVDAKYLICHVTSSDHMIQESCDVTGWSPWYKFTNLSRLVAINIAVVEKCF